VEQTEAVNFWANVKSCDLYSNFLKVKWSTQLKEFVHPTPSPFFFLYPSPTPSPTQTLPIKSNLASLNHHQGDKKGIALKHQATISQSICTRTQKAANVLFAF
jgi:hypothetical protein